MGSARGRGDAASGRYGDGVADPTAAPGHIAALFVSFNVEQSANTLHCRPSNGRPTVRCLCVDGHEWESRSGGRHCGLQVEADGDTGGLDPCPDESGAPDH